MGWGATAPDELPSPRETVGTGAMFETAGLDAGFAESCTTLPEILPTEEACRTTALRGSFNSDFAPGDFEGWLVPREIGASFDGKGLGSRTAASRLAPTGLSSSLGRGDPVSAEPTE
jgi:hypothetical protein